MDSAGWIDGALRFGAVMIPVRARPAGEEWREPPRLIELLGLVEDEARGAVPEGVGGGERCVLVAKDAACRGFAVLCEALEGGRKMGLARIRGERGARLAPVRSARGALIVELGQCGAGMARAP